jgi:hypothetical protein
MKINLTKIDRYHRIMFSSALLVLTLLRIEWGRVLPNEGLVVFMQAELLVTGIFGWCPFTWVMTKK